MFEFKYYAKIEAALEAPVDPQANTGFNIDELGVDSTARRARMRLLNWVVLALLWFLRIFRPNPKIGRLVIVTRETDVREVLRNPDVFNVPFGREMIQLTGGDNFALGMDGPAHDVQRAIMLAAMHPATDTPRILAETRHLTQTLIAGSGGRIDVMHDLVTRVAMETCSNYFGLDIDEPDAFADRAIAISALIFADPFGNDKIRRLALNGAARVRFLVDRAIRRAHHAPRADTVIDRLVEMQKTNPTLTDGQIRSIIIGMMTGLVPTNSLAAGKMLVELLHRPAARRDAIAHAAAAEEAHKNGDEDTFKTHRSALRDILYEAGRLSPALWPGQWRYAVTDGVIAAGTPRERKVPKDSIVLVATLSALRDRRAFPSPAAFRPGRRPAPELMFGTGTHECVGKYLAIEQITEIFLVLLAQKNIRVTDDPAGWYQTIGPFPRRLDMVFDPASAPAGQNMVTIQLPVRAGVDLAALQQQIARLGNPATADTPIGRALEATGIVHFASLSAIDAGDPPQCAPRILLELNIDGDVDAALAMIADKAEPALRPIIDQVENSAAMSLRDLLKRHTFDLHTYPWGAIGLPFFGTPDSSVGDIARQADLAAFAREALDHYLRGPQGLSSRAMEALTYVRGLISEHRPLHQIERDHALEEAARTQDAALREKGKTFRDFLIRPSRRKLAMSEWDGEGIEKGRAAFLHSWPVLYLSLLLGAVVSVMSATIYCLLAPSMAATFVLAVATAALIVMVCIGLWAGVQTFLRVALARLGLALPYFAVALAAAVIIGSGAAVYCALARWLPELASVPIRAALAVVGSVALPAIVIFALVKVAPLLRRYGPPLFPWIAGLVAVAAIYLAFVYVATLGAVLVAVTGGILSTVLLVILVIGVFFLLLRYHEIRDIPDTRSAPLESVRAIAARENAPGYVHNHITAVTPIKPGWFRKVTLALALWAIGKLVTYWYRPGFVLNMGTIHFARWFRLPGSEKLVFFSNYDGSWESYLEDFVIKAHKGQTAAWSNGLGFPPTRFLVLDGAQDGDRFKRWVRRQQIVTQCWYSRFPGLTTDQIRGNALIHDGLMRATTDVAARAWLDCFGTMPRPDYAMETDEVQSLVFRGFSGLRYTASALVQLPRERNARAAWLRLLSQELTFGEQPAGNGEGGTQTATFVAYSAHGIEKLSGEIGTDGAQSLAAFSSAFCMGMAARSHVLGDVGPSAPQQWLWADTDADQPGAGTPAADAILFVYAAAPEECTASLARHRAALGLDFLHVVNTQPVASDLYAPDTTAPPHEHFGFRDGVSQPVIRGTQRAANADDLIEAGEMILGYRNSAGYVPPSVTVQAAADPGNLLPTDTANFASRFPRFGAPTTADLRDFGRNGTFLAVRQFAQDVTGFETYTREQAARLQRDYRGLDKIVGGPVSPDWVAAKMMGRWRDGVSLMARSHDRESGSTDEPDNDFDFGTDDPQGLQCPLGAHIRRANPRGSLQPGDPMQPTIMKRHRLLRRGRSYETKQDGAPAEKGILFVGICADLERQFEFLQQSWVGSSAFNGLVNEPDPITSVCPAGAERVFTIPTTSGSITLGGLKDFVTVRGGGYFFMPSRSAVQFLGSLNGAAPP
jgi:Dyp-type peroxidase family